MKAVICAAGEGKRMRPYTMHFPKPLLRVGEKTILEHMLDNCSSCGLREVVIVVGYKADTVKEKIGKRYKDCTITYVQNDEYQETNNIYSLWLSRKHVTDGMVFFNGDILFHEKILEGILSNGFNDSFATDPFIALEDDSMKVFLKKTRLRKIGKHIRRTFLPFVPKANAWAIGIYKLSQEASRVYFNEAEKLFSTKGRNISFVEPLEAVAKVHPIKKHKVIPPYKWVEIDTPEDYAKAQRMVYEIVEAK